VHMTVIDSLEVDIGGAFGWSGPSQDSPQSNSRMAYKDVKIVVDRLS